MTIARSVIRGAAAAFGTVGLVTLTTLAAAPARAAVDVSSCTGSADYGTGMVAVTCYNPGGSVWDVRVECDYPGTRVVYIGGSRVYTVGWGTSLAKCPAGTEIGSETVQDL